jgi:hypothetical protein
VAYLRHARTVTSKHGTLCNNRRSGVSLCRAELHQARCYATLIKRAFTLGCDVTRQCRERAREVFPAWSIRGFIGDTEVRLQWVLGGRQLREVCSRIRRECVIWRLCVCVILGVCDSVSYDFLCFNCFTRRGLVYAQQWILKCVKKTIALCCLYFNVIKRECVTKVLINPIIRTRTRHLPLSIS